MQKPAGKGEGPAGRRPEKPAGSICVRSYAMRPEDIAIFADEEWIDLNNITTICTSMRKINAHGSFLESNPLDNSVPLLLMQFFLASTAIFFTSQLLKPLGPPIFVSQILVSLSSSIQCILSFVRNSKLHALICNKLLCFSYQYLSFFVFMLTWLWVSRVV